MTDPTRDTTQIRAERATVIGLGQLGGLFAHGFLRIGMVVTPQTRKMVWPPAPTDVPPDLVLAAVGEAALDPLLKTLPETHRPGLVLVQNELLPIDWLRHSLEGTTIAIVWFEKKAKKPLNIIEDTLLCGPKAELLARALSELDIPCEIIDKSRLIFELVKKNLYILTANIAGLEVGGSVAELWNDHKGLAKNVAREVLALQSWRAGEKLDEDALIEAMAKAFMADPDHGCAGRSAPARLARALRQADEAGLAVETLRTIAETHC